MYMVVVLLVIIAAVLLFGAKGVRTFLSRTVLLIIGMLTFIYGIGVISEDRWVWGITWLVLGGLIIISPIIGSLIRIVKTIENFKK
jgi:hypothetical protein